MSRKFLIKHRDLCNAESSTFKSATPASAASKAFNKTCKTKKACSRVINIVDAETNKNYRYRVSRKVQKKKVMINGVPVNFKYATSVKSMN